MSDQPHVLVEGVDGVVYYLAHDSAIAAARANGKLKPNSFVQFRSTNSGGDSVRTVDDLGDADEILYNRTYLKRTLGRLVQRGIIQDQNEWSGWLGRYQAAIRRETGLDAENEPPMTNDNTATGSRSGTVVLSQCDSRAQLRAPSGYSAMKPISSSASSRRRRAQSAASTVSNSERSLKNRNPSMTRRIIKPRSGFWSLRSKFRRSSRL